MLTLGGGRYRMATEIASGAIGTVWRAQDTRTGTPVAIKWLLPETAGNPDVVAAFLTEAEILAELDHPGVVRVHEMLREQGGYALVLAFVDGADLRRRLHADGPLPPAVAADVVAQIADALGYVHGRGVVHGDIKPGNILVPADGSAVRLADFGVARRIPVPGRSGEPERPAYATPEYVSPEVVAGDPPRPPADVYALGLVLFELLCGRTPYRGGGSDAVLRRHVTCVPVPPPGFPAALWPVLMDCVALDPRSRPAAGALGARLRATLPALAGLPALPVPGPEVVTWWPRSAEDTAPLGALRQRVTWVPEPRLGPDRPASARLVAVPRPDGGVPFAGSLVADTPTPSATPMAAAAPAPAGVAARAGTSRRGLWLGLAGTGLLALVLATAGVSVLVNGWPGGHRPVAGVSPATSAGAGPSGTPAVPAPAPTGSAAPTPATDPDSADPGASTDPVPPPAPSTDPDPGYPPLPTGLPSIGGTLPGLP